MDNLPCNASWRAPGPDISLATRTSGVNNSQTASSSSGRPSSGTVPTAESLQAPSTTRVLDLEDQLLNLTLEHPRMKASMESYQSVLKTYLNHHGCSLTPDGAQHIQTALLTIIQSALRVNPEVWNTCFGLVLENNAGPANPGQSLSSDRRTPIHVAPLAPGHVHGFDPTSVALDGSHRPVIQPGHSSGLGTVPEQLQGTGSQFDGPSYDSALGFQTGPRAQTSRTRANESSFEQFVNSGNNQEINAGVNQSDDYARRSHAAEEFSVYRDLAPNIGHRPPSVIVSEPPKTRQRRPTGNLEPAEWRRNTPRETYLANRKAGACFACKTARKRCDPRHRRPSIRSADIESNAV